MSRQLPTKPNNKQKTIIKAVSDYYGAGITNQEKLGSKVVALFIMGRKARLQPMSDGQKSDMWAVKTNLEDPTYVNSLSD